MNDKLFFLFLVLGFLFVIIYYFDIGTNMMKKNFVEAKDEIVSRLKSDVENIKLYLKNKKDENETIASRKGNSEDLQDIASIEKETFLYRAEDEITMQQRLSDGSQQLSAQDAKTTQSQHTENTHDSSQSFGGSTGEETNFDSIVRWVNEIGESVSRDDMENKNQ